MEVIRNWTNCLIVVIAMIGIIEVIVPEGETKKFVFLVTQIIVSIVIAIPILSFLKKDFELEEVFNISGIQESSFYVDTLRNSVDRQTEILEEVFSENVVKEFNSIYSDMQLVDCKIYFTRDTEGKIKEINLVEVSVANKIDNIETLKSRVAKLCEVDNEKVKVI